LEAETFERVYPLGALSEREAADIKVDPFCTDQVTLDELIEDWKVKSKTFQSRLPRSLGASDREILPLEASPETRKKIETLLTACRPYLPSVYTIGLVPIEKLISAQRFVEPAHARRAFNGMTRPLTDEENAEHCLGNPIRDVRIDGSFLGSNDAEGMTEFVYNYQFSSDDPNVRFIPPMPLKPMQDLNNSMGNGGTEWKVKSVPISVGPGLPFVHVLKVPVYIDNATREPVHRLLISNGFHRIFRLAELGNTHAAALIQTMDARELPERYIMAPRESLFAPNALKLTDLLDKEITRSFAWKKSKRVIRLMIKVVQDVMLVG